MFTSVRILTDQFGVDPDIARFFVDRAVPQDNRYWKGRLLYVAHGNGYLFIPLVYDLLYRLGVPKQQLLEEGHIGLMESVLDSAGKVEFDGLPGSAHVEACREILCGSVHNAWLWQELQVYFQGGPTEALGLPIPPLNRADTFLFSLCNLDMDESLTRSFLKYWYALISAFLLMDDVADWDVDREQGEENAIRHLGEGKEAFSRALEMLHGYFATLESLNPSLGPFFERSLQKHLKSGTYRQ